MELPGNIINTVSQLLTDGKLYIKMTHVDSSHSDGRATERIIETLKKLPVKLNFSLNFHAAKN